MTEVPRCPKADCGAPMVLRTAKRGRNAGGQFWGCTKYPHCTGTRAVEKSPGQSLPAPTKPAAAAPMRPEYGPRAAELEDRRRTPERQAAGPNRFSQVAWIDATLDRPGWIAQYAPCGASLRSVPYPPTILRATSTCWIAREDLPSFRPSDAGVVRVASLFKKVIQRGDPTSLRLLCNRCDAAPGPQGEARGWAPCS